MKKSFLLIFVVFLSFSASHAQEYSFGIKGGINYAQGGEIVGISSSVNGVDKYSTDTFNPDSKIGFHGGVFFELRMGKFFVRPEGMFNTIETEFTFVNTTSIYSIEKLSVPLLLGYNVFGPIDVYAGPVYQNILDTSLENTETNIVVQDSPLAAQLGLKAGLGRLEIDLRYDRSLASEDIYEINIQGDSTPNSSGGGHQQDGLNRASFDGRIHQVLLSLSFKIGDSKANPRRRSGRGCFF